MRDLLCMCNRQIVIIAPVRAEAEQLAINSSGPRPPIS